VEEEGREEGPDYNSRIFMDCTAAANLSFVSVCCGREMGTVIGGEMAVSLHFLYRAHCRASMEGTETSERTASANALMQSCVLIDAEVAALEALSFG
jgi:hypothetical protein